jgi:hypothetical protein
MRLLSAIKRHGLLWFMTHSALFVFDKWVEFALYPKAIGTYGVVGGIGAMMVFSLIVCWVLLAFYDWVSTIDTASIRRLWLRALTDAASDALGFETLKEAGGDLQERIARPVTFTKGSGSRAMIRNAILRVWEPVRKYVVAPIATRWFKPVLYVYLSVAHDGMTCLILMRPAHSHKMGLREWLLFVPSVLLSCIGWGLIVGGALTVLRNYAPHVYETIMWLVGFVT